MARTLDEKAAATEYHELFLKAQKTYVGKLWNGEYFRYDTDSEYRDSVQADQLAGQWYANMTGLGDLVPHEMQLAASKKIFDFNVMKFGGGEMGAANGMAADGSILSDNEQGLEVWVGTSFGFAALLLSEGMRDEASEQALAAAFHKDGYRDVKRFRRTDDVADEECWVKAPGWSLTYH